MKIAVVTGCIAGVAQSHMAAVALCRAAEVKGHQVVCEEQGGHKLTNRLSPEDVQTADVVIFATAIDVSDKGRFGGKAILELPVYKALMDPTGTIDKAVGLVA